MRKLRAVRLACLGRVLLVLVAAASATSASGPAHAVAGRGDTGIGLPPAGAVVTLAETVHATVVYQGSGHPVTLTGAAEVSVGDPAIRDGRLALPLTVTDEVLLGHSQDLGYLRVEATKPETAYLTERTWHHPFPATGELATSIRLTADAFPGVTLVTRHPVVMENPGLSAFPPANAVYRATAPVELVQLVNANRPGRMLVVLEDWQAIVN